MIPNEVKIGGIIYPVLQDCDEELDKEECLGRCGYYEPSIKLLSTLPKQRKEQAFIHEMIHLALFEAGFTCNIYNNEKMVRPIANMIHQILKDNKFNFND